MLASHAQSEKFPSVAFALFCLMRTSHVHSKRFPSSACSQRHSIRADPLLHSLAELTPPSHRAQSKLLAMLLLAFNPSVVSHSAAVDASILQQLRPVVWSRVRGVGHQSAIRMNEAAQPPQSDGGCGDDNQGVAPKRKVHVDVVSDVV